ncbi:MAG: proprotein convertase P-domain-containing protein, partial [Bacteroidota bacterium]
DDLVLTVIASAGPFLVQSPNTALTWIVGTTETVTWDVANTNSLPVSCAAMDILLSTDGGLTYPTVLAEGVPNNGMADIVVPNMVGDQNRVMVLCASNVFFDISNTDFSIEVPPNPTFTLNLNPSSLDICGGETANYNLNLGSLVGFNQPVQLSALGLPAGANIDFSVNPVTSFPTDVQVSISNLTAATGLYTFQIIGTSGNIELNQTADLNLYNGIPIASQLLSPADGEEGVNLETVLTWDLQNDAQSYEIEIASNPNFGSSILETATVETNTYTPENLGTFQVYFWRVKAINPCGESTFSATFAFQTLGNACFDYSSTNVPIEIPANTAVAVSSNLTIDDELTISDINVQTNLSHTWVGDISMELISPEGTTINLMDRPGVPGSTYGCNQDDISVVFDDEAILTADDLEAACEDNGTAIEGSYRPIDPLSTLVGKEAEGNWLLIVEDAVEEDGGALDSWQLEICVQQQSGILTFLYRSPLRVEQGSSKELDEFILSLFSSSSSNEDITFLITDLTDHGEIRRDGQPLGLSETFTQAEINNGQIEYVHDGSMTTSDELRFDVFDTGGGWLRDEFLQITIFDNSGQPGPSVIVVNEIACHGETGAIFYVDVFGGLPPYEYQLEGITDYQEENIFADLPAGTYTILVRDANNQIGELNDILVAQPEPIELSATVNFRNITAMASGGTGAFQYSLDQVDYQSSPEFTNLPNGSYKIYAQDMNACLDSTEVEVNVAALIIESVSTLNTACFDTEDGNLSVEMVSGGVPPYTYSLNGGPFQTESIFDNIGSGEYTLTVRDDTGEEVTDTYTIESPDELMISVQTVDNSIIVSASGGTGSLFYSLDEGITLQEDSVFNDLPNDTYIVTVVDDNGCTISTEVVIDIVDITEIPGLSFSIFPNPSNAVFQVDIQAATGAVEMRLYDALGRQLQFAELGTGQHIIDMNDQSGGIYFLQMSHQSKSLVRQLVLIK